MRVKRLPVAMTLEGGLQKGGLQKGGALDGGAPVARQVAHALARAIGEGQLVPGDAMPSSRDLAAQFGVARNTVLEALGMLSDDGVVETRPGIGSFVRDRGVVRGSAGAGPAASFGLSGWGMRLPGAAGVLEQAGTPPLDLRPGLPDLRTIPFDEWRRSAARKLRTLRAQVGCYGEPAGDPALRVEVARYLARSRGVRCGAEDVIVTSGAQQAFDLVARVLIEPGAAVAFEEPGYAPAAQVFRAAGARLEPVAVDADGFDASRIPAGVSVAYVTPSHQYPLGAAMSAERRAALLAWAAREDGVIVEDDYDSEFQYGARALPALQGGGLGQGGPERGGAGAGARVIYVGTFSKNLMPGIRLGYMVAPAALTPVFVRAKWLMDRHTDNVSQSSAGGVHGERAVRAARDPDAGAVCGAERVPRRAWPGAGRGRRAAAAERGRAACVRDAAARAGRGRGDRGGARGRRRAVWAAGRVSRGAGAGPGAGLRQPGARRDRPGDGAAAADLATGLSRPALRVWQYRSFRCRTRAAMFGPRAREGLRWMAIGSR